LVAAEYESLKLIHIL